jgi:hypothetical protein
MEDHDDISSHGWSSAFFGSSALSLSASQIRCLRRWRVELEHDGIIERIVYPVVPPKVEYKLSPVGVTVIPLIKNMVEWGESMSEASE